MKIPPLDWPKVKLGIKRELRVGRTFIDPPTPTPIVAYSHVRYQPVPETMLMVLESSRAEMLLAITAESLALEGFETLKEFKAYWKARFPRRGFRPLQLVTVLRLRPFTDDDLAPLGELMLRRVYDKWLT